MTALEAQVRELKFKRVGLLSIHPAGKYPYFEIEDPVDKRHGHVYLWILEQKKKPIGILYIGRAGKTLKARCAQHEGGFKGGSKSGIRNAGFIVQKLEQKGASIGIYSRYSKQMVILGEQHISLSHAEEAALIQKFKAKYKLLNKAT